MVNWSHTKAADAEMPAENNRKTDSAFSHVDRGVTEPPPQPKESPPLVQSVPLCWIMLCLVFPVTRRRHSAAALEA